VSLTIVSIRALPRTFVNDATRRRGLRCAHGRTRRYARLAPKDKHRTIHQRLADLREGEALRIYNDHDPRPLKFEIERTFRESFPGITSIAVPTCGGSTSGNDRPSAAKTSPSPAHCSTAAADGDRLLSDPAYAKQRLYA